MNAVALLAPGSGPSVAIPALTGLGFGAVAITVNPIGHLLTLLSALCIAWAVLAATFYRDPERRPHPDPDGLGVPADGRVLHVTRVRATARRPGSDHPMSTEDPITGPWHDGPPEDPMEFTTEFRWEPVPTGEEGDRDAWHVAIHMTLLDVHVNRTVVAGKIIAAEHRTGQGRRRGPFRRSDRKDAPWNERVRWVIRTEGGTCVEMMQIAGAMTRGILPWRAPGDVLQRGDRLGMIRLGSRFDVRFPASDWTPVIRAGEDVRASEDRLATLTR